MDLLHLAAKIELDDSSYNKGIKGAERAAQSLQGKMSAMTVAAGNIAADLIRKGVSAVQSIVGGAVDAYADYEQLVGGVDTLFKQSSEKVQKYAKESFRTTGLSANAYMETVTSFSASLLQGLDGDTETAADLANMAITDMADNANKMGTDMTSIQNAYQGFAKQNYTMLDNLIQTACRERGIKIILDGVFSHTGADSKYFNKFDRYDGVGAYKAFDEGEESRYRSWYNFFRNADGSVGYDSWWGFPDLPNINEDDLSYRNFIFGKDGVVDTWTSRGAAGFRLDVSDELPDSFIRQMRQTVKEKTNGEGAVIGEVWEDASNKCS